MEPGTAAGTTGDGGWEPVTVTAVLAEPVIGLWGHPAHLDGPAAWSAFLSFAGTAGRLALPRPEDAPVDFTLPLAAWTAPAPPGADPLALAADPAMTWGWACSRAIYDTGGHTVVNVRKHPETGPAARYSADAKWDVGGGPLKAKDVPFSAELIREVRWHALADPGPLLAMLSRVPSLGRLGGHGNGRVLSWRADTGGDRDAWRDRVMPHPGGAPGSVRAPYWHQSRRMPCTR